MPAKRSKNRTSLIQPKLRFASPKTPPQAGIPARKTVSSNFWLTIIRWLYYCFFAIIVTVYSVAFFDGCAGYWNLRKTVNMVGVSIWAKTHGQGLEKEISRKKVEDIRMGLDRSVTSWTVSSWIRKTSYLTLTLLCFLAASTHYGFGQVDEGSITGTVQDSSGAVVPNAQVTLLNTDQGLTLQTKTGSTGAYSFSPVRIGHYTITVTASGFSKTTQENLQVAVSQNLQVNVELKTGAATETVTVTEAPPQLQTEDASVGQVVTEQTINSLPLNGRNFTFLAQLGAGMQTPQADTRGNAASGAFSANGLRPSQNNYLLDGIDNNSNAVDFLNGTNFAVLPPVDAIQEFKVQTGEFSAELGRSAGAVLNATIKSGTNSFHGAAWEFFRNDKLDAADWFESNSATPTKGELRLNQFGVTAGGPIIKNKIFIFGDYEGKRRVQGSSANAAVPTAAERSSGYTDLSDIISGTARADALGRQIIPGTVLDPATTRAVTAGHVDQVSGLTATETGYARDPFGCSQSNTAPTVASCASLNHLPTDRLNPNAVKLMNLFPDPNTGGTSTSSNFHVSPKSYEHSNSFDVRGDVNPNEKEQMFVRFSYVDDPQYIPGPFGGIADGGGFQQGLQTAKSSQTVGAWTHVFSPNMVNVGRVGFNHLHTTRFGPEGSVTGIPAQFNIQGIPQANENGGLGSYGIGGLQTLGSNAFLPSDEISQTLQITDDFTKIWGKHSFKMGMEFQYVKFSTLQPAFSRGNFDYNGSFTDIPNNNVSNQTGKAQFLLDPIAAPNDGVPGRVSFVGGSDSINASNINKTYDNKRYFATYIQDDYKVSPKLTLNLGLRWDYFGPISESNGGQANFVPSGAPSNKPIFIIPATGKDNRTLSSTANTPSLVDAKGNPVGFVDLLAKDGITLTSTNEYGKGLVQTQKYNFAPRVGLAYQATPKLVVRGGFGLFYNSFENQGYGPNIGENYPFVFNFGYTESNLASPGAFPLSQGTPYQGCSSSVNSAGTVTGAATLESGLSCINFSPSVVNASGLGLQGLQFDYHTPLTLSSNATLQYAITHSISAQVSYVVTSGRHLQAGVGSNHVSDILPKNLASGDSTANHVPFPDFSQGASYQATVGDSIYNGLQAKVEQQYANGLSFLVAYTYSKTLSDAGDLLNGGSNGGYRAPDVPGYGVKFDRGLADFDLRQVVHISGGYELPFGKNKMFMNHANTIVDTIAGGWAINWIATLQGGQPITLGCPTGATTGTGCNDYNVPGQSQKLGIKTDFSAATHTPVWFGNAAAFSQPCPLGVTPVPSNCIVAQNGFNILGGAATTTTGPGYHKLDFSTFKNFKINERFSAQFRAELFNILNHPNFNAPGFGGNGVVSISGSTDFTNANFGQIGSTRDGAYSSRQIQFAAKFYY